MFELTDQDNDRLQIYSESDGEFYIETTLYAENPQETVIATLVIENSQGLKVAEAVLSEAGIKADIIPQPTASVVRNRDMVTCGSTSFTASANPDDLEKVASEVYSIAKFLRSSQASDQALKEEARRKVMDGLEITASLTYDQLPAYLKRAVDRIVALDTLVKNLREGRV